MPPPIEDPIEDRISALPDEILRHILSFLPTKLAFTTSVLSKRWTPICHSLTVLHFDDEGKQDEETYLRFRRFVDTVLLSPQFQHQPIQTLSLMSRSFLTEGDRFNVDEWVEAAKQRCVVHLQLSTTWILPLSPSIFTSSRTLVVLKLSGLIVSHDVGSVDLPSLTTLHLINISFQKGDDVKKILDGCPIVEDLYAIASNSGDGVYTTGYKPLPKVAKANISAYYVPFGAIYNVEFLHIEQLHRRKSEKCINSFYIGMPVFRNLISIELSFFLFPTWDVVVELLPYCPKLQSLAIEKYGQRRYRQFNKKEWTYVGPVPDCVSLHLKTCSIGNYEIKGMCDDFNFAAYILQNARVLQVLTLDIHPCWDKSDMDQFFKRLSECPKISPACKIKFVTSSS